MNNKPHSKEARMNISKSVSKTWTEQRRKSHSEALKGRKMPPRSKSSSIATSKAKLGFSWMERDFGSDLELQRFKGCHDRVRDGKSPSIQWERNLEGFKAFLDEIGEMPKDMEKPSVGRINHSRGYEVGNIQWEEHSLNSIKRKGTKYEAANN